MLQSLFNMSSLLLFSDLIVLDDFLIGASGVKINLLKYRCVTKVKIFS